jgi:hypothetical protein
MRTAKAALVLLGAIAMAGLTSGVSLASSFGHHHFYSSGTGVETSLSPVGCQTVPSGCTTRTDGVAETTFLGRSAYVSTVTVNWSAATPNGQGGFCAPAAENTHLWNNVGSVVLTSASGQECEVGASGPNVRHRFTGDVAVSGAAWGRRIVGVGTTYRDDDGFAHASYGASGHLV